MDIGGRIRTARKAAGLSQEELARRAGMSLKGMGDIERGDIEDPHYSSLSKIADGLGMSIGELLEENLPKAEAPTSSLEPTLEEGEERRAYPYPWMSGALAETVAHWSNASLEQNDPKYSHFVAVACFDVMRSVLKYDVPGKTLRDRVPENEVEERLKLVDWLHEVARRAQEHYVDSKEAEVAEVKDLEERSENVVRLIKETA